MTSSKDQNKDQDRLEMLDVIRGLAAFSIFVYHFFALSPTPIPQFFSGIKSAIGNYAGLGVPVFYALSGLSLFYGFFHKRETPGFIRLFFVRRVFRIAPLFYITLFIWITIIVSYGGGIEPAKLIATLTFVFNLIPGLHDSYVAAGWSVGVEVLFYVLFPCLVLIATSLRKAFALFIGASIVTALVYDTLSRTAGPEYAYMSVLSHMPYFTVGILAFFVRGFVTEKLTQKKSTTGAGVILFLCAIIIAIGMVSGSIRQFLHYPSPAVWQILWALPIGLMLSGASLLPIANPLRNLVTLGHWSFSVYLLHPIVIFAATKFILATGLDKEARLGMFVATFGITLALLLVLSGLSYRFIELPFIKMARFYTGHGVDRAADTPQLPYKEHNLSWFGNRRILAIMVIGMAACGYFHYKQAIRFWEHTLLGHHGFRQGQTALTTKEIFKNGLKLNYETPVFGPPWSIPMEYPVYQTVVAKTARAFDMPLEPVGRTVSLAFFYLSLPVIWMLLALLGVNFFGKCTAVMFSLVSPLYIYWSRAFLIESTTLFFSLLFITLTLYFLIKKNSWLVLALASLAGAIAALAKITTFAVSFGFIILFLLYLWFKKSIRGKLLYHCLLLIGIPITIGAAWVRYGDHVKRHQGTPMAEVILSDHLKIFNFGTLAQRFSASFWETMYYHGVQNITYAFWPWLVLIPCIFLCRKIRPLLLIFFATFASGPLVFSNLYFVHDYYWYANAIFLLIALALAFGELFEKSPIAKLLCALGVLLVTITTSLGYKKSSFYIYQKQNETYVEELGHLVSSMTAEKDVIMITGFDWDSSLAYYSDRRAIMPWVRGFESHPGTVQAVKRITDEGRQLSLLVVGGKDHNDPAFMDALRKRYEFASIPAWDDGKTAIYSRAISKPGELLEMGACVLSFGAALPVQFIEQGNNPAWLFHAPSFLEVSTPPSAKSFSVKFGLDTRTYQGANGTDGATFQISAVLSNGEHKQIWSHELEPLKNDSDKGIQSISIAIPENTVRLILETSSGKSTSDWDWTLWGKMAFN